MHLSRATLRNIRQNLFFAFAYNSLGVPLAGGVLFPFFGWLLSPMIASAAMSLASSTLSDSESLGAWASRPQLLSAGPRGLPPNPRTDAR